MEGGIILAATGYIQVRAYTSRSEIPLQDTAITVVTQEGQPIALRLTNRSGKLEEVIPITVPDFAESQEPNPGEKPFTTVNLFARKDNYGQIDIYGLQVFADTVTTQNLELIPLAEFPDASDEESFSTPPQNL